MLGPKGSPLEGITLPVALGGGRIVWRLSPHELLDDKTRSHLLKMMSEALDFTRQDDPMRGGAIYTWTAKDLRPAYPHPTNEPY